MLFFFSWYCECIIALLYTAWKATDISDRPVVMFGVTINCFSEMLPTRTQNQNNDSDGRQCNPYSYSSLFTPMMSSRGMPHKMFPRALSFVESTALLFFPFQYVYTVIYCKQIIHVKHAIERTLKTIITGLAYDECICKIGSGQYTLFS